MRVRPLDPSHRLARGMLTFARRAELLEALELRPASTRSHALIVVADGEPDNRVLLVLARTLDGRTTVDVAFPVYKHLSVFEVVHVYVYEGYKKVVIMLDRERDELSRIHEYAKRRVQLEVEGYAVDEGVEGRMATMRVREGATTYIVVNGVSDCRLARHAVEDHLLKAGEALGVVSIHSPADPKSLWERLGRDRQMLISRRLASSERLAEALLPQRVAALGKLASPAL